MLFWLPGPAHLAGRSVLMLPSTPSVHQQLAVLSLVGLNL